MVSIRSFWEEEERSTSILNLSISSWCISEPTLVTERITELQNFGRGSRRAQEENPPYKCCSLARASHWVNSLWNAYTEEIAWNIPFRAVAAVSAPIQRLWYKPSLFRSHGASPTQFCPAIWNMPSDLSPSVVGIATLWAGTFVYGEHTTGRE
jgi:hypothetical protein